MPLAQEMEIAKDKNNTTTGNSTDNTPTASPFSSPTAASPINV